MQVQHWNGDGIEGLGADAAAPAAAPTWWENLISAGTQIAQGAAQVKAAKEIAKTGQVPTAQLNVGMAPETQKMLMIGGIALGGVLLLSMLKKRR